MNEVLLVLAVIVVIGSVIVRQLRANHSAASESCCLPVILIVVGAINLHGSSHLKTIDIVCIAASAAVAIAIGAGQGVVMHLQSRDGGLWGRMPARGLWWWPRSSTSRVVMAIVAGAIGAKTASSVDSFFLCSASNRLPKPWS